MRWIGRIKALLALGLVGSPPYASARERMLEIIHEHSGIASTDLRKALGIGWGAFYRHLAVLERELKVDIVHHGRRTLLYPAGMERTYSVEKAYLRGATARSIAIAIQRRPNCDILDLREATGESSRVVYHHVRKLIQHGLVSTPSRTRVKDLHATPLLGKILPELEAEAWVRDGSSRKE